MLERLDIEERRIVVGQLSDFGTSVLRHPDAAGLFAMWQALRGDRVAPFRAELDAGKIGARAPYLAILEYVSASNFRIRIAGDRVNKWFGLELRGMSALSLVAPEARNHLQGALNRVTAEPAVAAVQGVATRADGFSAPFDLVLLPMRSDFGRIDRVLVGLWLVDAPSAAAGPLRLEASAFTVASLAEPLEGAEPAPLAEIPLVEPDPLDLAEPPAPADAQPLRAIEGGGESKGGARRGHLRLVKKH